MSSFLYQLKCRTFFFPSLELKYLHRSVIFFIMYGSTILIDFYDRGIDFYGLSSSPGLFYAKRLESRVHLH